MICSRLLLLVVCYLTIVTLLSLVVKGTELSNSNNNGLVVDFLQCQLCHTPDLQGAVDDSCCDYKTVDAAVDQHFHPLLQRLSKLSFFRYFKVNLYKKCPFWKNSDGMCASRECAVCECDAREVPAPWKLHDSINSSPSCDDQIGVSSLSHVTTSTSSNDDGDLFQKWIDPPNVDNNIIWADQDVSDNVYVNLLKNPERFTGYSGLYAERIWQAIYNENCFGNSTSSESSNLEGMCLEERVFYRLISGMQTSINTHIAMEYLINDVEMVWGVNTQLYIDRVGKFPERLENLYFTYLFVMRAVGRASHLLMSYEYDSGNAEEDAEVRVLIKKLVSINRDDESNTCLEDSVASRVLKGFDEHQLFQSESMKEMEDQFREKFQNISRIMDCVTCHKCRLWGKVQLLGIGTAIKINLADTTMDIPSLTRNEIIALINVLVKLSESVDSVSTFRQLEFYEALKPFFVSLLITLVVTIIGILIYKKI